MEVVVEVREVDNQFWIVLTACGCTLDKRGGYPSAAAAEEAAKPLRRRWNARKKDLPPPRQHAESDFLDVLGLMQLAQEVRGS